jgi:DNA repair protein RAD7
VSKATRPCNILADSRCRSQSALTDFLASHNISAQQIHTDYQRRLREAQEQGAQSPSNEQDEDKENAMDVDEDENGETIEERKKRKRKEEKALAKIKQSKEFKRKKSEHKRNSSDDESDDAIARSMLAKAQPLPGQLENCEICEKRFTVTAYSKTGPDGGLLCTKCSKELANEEKKNQPKKRRGPPKGKRRQTESDRMMGNVQPGSKSLLETCVLVGCDMSKEDSSQI